MRIVIGLELLFPKAMLSEDRDRLAANVTDAVPLLDRRDMLLFVEEPHVRNAIARIAADCGADCESGDWLMLSSEWLAHDRHFTDYGVVARDGLRFLDLQSIAVVELAAGAGGPSELAAAAEQASEHAIAERTQEDGRRLYAVDRHLIELIAGIARAYRCAYALIVPASAR